MNLTNVIKFLESIANKPNQVLTEYDVTLATDLLTYLVNVEKSLNPDFVKATGHYASGYRDALSAVQTEYFTDGNKNEKL